MKIVFTCAGNQTRWANYMNYPKHLVPINGVPLLQRNINLFDKVFNHPTYYVSIKNENLKELYTVHEKITFFITDNVIEDYEPAYKTLIPFLNNSDDVLILLGDVIFSEDCVKQIYENSLKNTFNVFGRKTPSSITGCKWGEIFAFYIPSSFKDKFIGAVNVVENLYKQEKIGRFSGWEIISYIYSGKKNVPDIHIRIRIIFKLRLFPKSFINIDDETDDFDFPDDYINYVKRFCSVPIP
jgi:hypothetical protein